MPCSAQPGTPPAGCICPHGGWPAGPCTHQTTWVHPLGPVGSPQYLLLGVNHPWWPQEPAVLLCLWWPYTAIWAWCAPLVALSIVLTTWAQPLCPIESPRHLLLGLHHSKWLLELAVPLCPPAPWWPHTAIWAWDAPLVAASRSSAAWTHPLGPIGGFPNSCCLGLITHGGHKSH